jgi:hypothetical protein
MSTTALHYREQHTGTIVITVYTEPSPRRTSSTTLPSRPHEQNAASELKSPLTPPPSPPSPPHKQTNGSDLTPPHTPSLSPSLEQDDGSDPMPALLEGLLDSTSLTRPPSPTTTPATTPDTSPTKQPISPLPESVSDPDYSRATKRRCLAVVDEVLEVDVTSNARNWHLQAGIADPNDKVTPSAPLFSRATSLGFSVGDILLWVFSRCTRLARYKLIYLLSSHLLKWNMC